MKLELFRTEYNHDGIIGSLINETGKEIAVTLEHAYDSKLGDGSYLPKLPKGSYTCKRGLHKLHDLAYFETFEVLGVQGHAGILFHVGNYNKDSDGCILLGKHVTKDKVLMITDSRLIFNKFMTLQTGIDQFTLAVDGRRE